MNIKTVKIKSEAPFTQVPNDLIRNPEISSNAKALYAYMMSRGSNWKFYVTEIQKHIKDGRDRIYKSINELIEFGYVEKEETRTSDGKFMGSSYIVHYKPITEKPYTAKPDTANQTLRIKNSNNKDNKYNRAHRLSEDWTKSNEAFDCVQWAINRGWSLDDAKTEAIKFFNYWTSLGDVKRARKSNWIKTWQNWILNAESYKSKGNRGNTQRSSGLAESMRSVQDSLNNGDD